MEEISPGGGGKIKSVYHRLNAYSELDGFTPVLLTIEHSISQKLRFSALNGEGKLSPQVFHKSLPEICAESIYQNAIKAPIFPLWDNIFRSGNIVKYLSDGILKMEDFNRTTAIGKVTNRTVWNDGRVIKFTLINGRTFQKIVNNQDGTSETTDYVDDHPVRWVKKENQKFILGKNMITGRVCRTPKILSRSLLEAVDLRNDVVFIDGIKISYLSNATNASTALFLHTEHRDRKGTVLPKYKTLLKNFKGAAIVTATHVHRCDLENDLNPTAKIHVIPHFCNARTKKQQQRKNIVTISRLSLREKPIDDCLRAYALIKDEFPDVNYCIFGGGAGHKFLDELIHELGCQDRVTLMGYTKDPLSIFNTSLASLYPTLSEGFGLSILESLSVGCPVITYDVKYGPQEMIKPGVNGYLVSPGCIDELADSIRAVLRDPARHSCGCELGLENYTYQAHLKNYRELAISITKST